MSTVNVGDVWARREALEGDPYNTVTVVGVVTSLERPDEYTLQPLHEFGTTIQTTKSGLVDHCDLISSGDPNDKWETDL
jgi:hypothetical protein